MTFTDDDLKRIKNYLGGGDDTWFDGFTVGTIKALLARLEAAEAVCKFIGNSDDNTVEDEVQMADTLMAAWRKAAGK